MWYFTTRYAVGLCDCSFSVAAILTSSPTPLAFIGEPTLVLLKQHSVVLVCWSETLTTVCNCISRPRPINQPAEVVYLPVVTLLQIHWQGCIWWEITNKKPQCRNGGFISYFVHLTSWLFDCKMSSSVCVLIVAGWIDGDKERQRKVCGRCTTGEVDKEMHLLLKCDKCDDIRQEYCKKQSQMVKKSNMPVVQSVTACNKVKDTLLNHRWIWQESKLIIHMAFFLLFCHSLVLFHGVIHFLSFHLMNVFFSLFF